MEKSGVALLSIAAETVSSRNCDTPASLGDSAVSLKGAIHKIYKNSSSLNDSAVRPKLVLPELTLDVRKDLESGRLSSADLPLSISKRQEWLEYPLKNIAAPHPNDVRKFMHLIILIFTRCLLIVILGRTFSSLWSWRRFEQPSGQ